VQIFGSPPAFDLPIVAKTLTESPLVVVDVGAAGGIQDIWRENGATRYARYFGFEPNPQNFAELKDDEVTRYFQMALSDSVGPQEFFAHSVYPTNSSLRPPPSTPKDPADRHDVITVDVSTIAQLRQEEVLPAVDVLKIDAERNDYFVLEGAGDYLESEILCVAAEVEYYQIGDRNQFADIHKLMTGRGFLLFGVAVSLGTLGDVGGGDVLYLKDIGSILASDDSDQRKWERAVKLFTVAAIMHHHRYAYAIARAAEDAGILGSEEARVLRKFVEDSLFLPFAFSPFLRSRRLAHLFSLLAQIIWGPKWGAKSAPRFSTLRSYRHLSLNRGFAPRAWARRHKAELDRHYGFYENSRGFHYKDF